jgi:hypothetical protein
VNDSRVGRPYRLGPGKQAAPHRLLGNTGARCATRAMLAPQIGLSIAFFLPSYEACHIEDAPASPNSLAEFTLGELSFLTTFCAAMLLLVLDGSATARSAVSGRPARRHRWRRWLYGIAAITPAFVTLEQLDPRHGSAFLGGIPWSGIASALALALIPIHLYRSGQLRGYRADLHSAMGGVLLFAPIGCLYALQWVEHGDRFEGAVLHLLSCACAISIGYIGLSTTFAMRTDLARSFVAARAKHRRGRPRRIILAPAGDDSPMTMTEDAATTEAASIEEDAREDRKPSRRTP